MGASAGQGAGARERGELTRGLLVTGAGGQLAEALREEFASEHVVALGLEGWDVKLPPPADLPEVDVALHAAAWTDVGAVRRVGLAEPALGLRPHEAAG